MREFKFDINVILRNCERFGVKVESMDHCHGVTMNGKPFDVTEEINKAFKELEGVTSTTSRTMVSSGTMSQECSKRPEVKVTLGETRKTIPEQDNFSKFYASLNAA